jgi:hypothetical protein
VGVGVGIKSPEAQKKVHLGVGFEPLHVLLTSRAHARVSVMRPEHKPLGKAKEIWLIGDRYL